MPDYDFYLQGNPDVVLFQCVELSHPSFRKTYRYVKNNVDGLTVKHEDGTKRDYLYSPLTVKKSKTSDDLDQSLDIGVGDLGEDFPIDLDRLRNGQYPNVKPTLNYREYRSDKLDTPMYSILNMELTDYHPQKQGAVFTCKAHQLNISQTGETYTIKEFPMLQGFI